MLTFLSTVCESGCDFDDSDPENLCGWTIHTVNPALFGFSKWTGPTETDGTGPDDDFSKPGCNLLFLLSMKATLGICQIIFYPQKIHSLWIKKHFSSFWLVC